MKICLFVLVCVLMMCSLTSARGIIASIKNCFTQSPDKPKQPKLTKDIRIVKSLVLANNSVQLDWTSPKLKDRFFFIIKCSDNKYGDYYMPQNESTASYTTRNLEPNTEYTFQVVARDNRNSWQFESDSVVIKTLGKGSLDDAPLEQNRIKDMKIEKISLTENNSVQLGWISPSFKDRKFGIMFHDLSGTQMTWIEYTSSYTTKNLQSNKMYRFKVIATNTNTWKPSDGDFQYESDWAEINTLTKGADIKDLNPEITEAEVLTEHSVFLRWKYQSSEHPSSTKTTPAHIYKSHIKYRPTTSEKSFTEIRSVPATTYDYTVDNLSPNMEYEFYVKNEFVDPLSARVVITTFKTRH